MLSYLYNNLFLCSVIYLTIATNKYFFNFNNIIFLFSLFIHLAFTIIYIKLFPYSDWETYFFWADSLEPKNLKFHNFFSSHLVVALIVYLKHFLFLKKINIILLFSLFSFFGILIFVRNLIKLGVEKKITYFFLFIPTFHFWTSMPGKDSLIILLLSIFFYFYLEKKFFISILFILLVSLLRPHVGVIFFLSYLLSEIFFAGTKKKITLFLNLLIFLFLILYFPRTAGFFLTEKDIFIDNIFYQALNQLHIIMNKYQMTNSAYENTNILSNIFNYFIFPTDLIFKKTSLLTSFSIFIDAFTFVLVAILIFRNRKLEINNKKLIIFLSLISIIYCLVFPQIFFNYGLNSRQKWMILPFVIYLSFSLRNLFVKINKI